MSAGNSNSDSVEIGGFNRLADRWWDPAGEMRYLHRMNPVRLAFIAGHARLGGARIVDVGCGAGLLSESLALAGAEVLGIDLAEDLLAVARLHQQEGAVAHLRYERDTAEALAERSPAAFDAVTCLEMLEHVPDPAAVVAACARLLRPRGTAFFSTINRNAAAWMVTVAAAEYLLGVLPRGTHEYSRFIRPSELARMARAAGLELQDMKGLLPDEAGGDFRLGEDLSVNYIASFRRKSP
ncbi:MAG: bifunctional 2-polyprenyl-6-hydroxyphenol methylase/3-demethylubiquinol 3-O-methyltransferase UbiG [Gammaproteobacteria bacterium]|nr:bifunctional 2-polyprenyl-6-hydroxyphenol methylase/3-demethylubiquinol 3-O-methyltransferase UbiG [Gammaproteobacteria bacterium]